MIVAVCVDNNNGMMFNARRQSRDHVLIKNIKELANGRKVYIRSYSKTIFPDAEVNEYCLEIAEINDICFIENDSLSEFEQRIDKLILYKWNRDYPADMYLGVDLSNWVLEDIYDFEGSSHDKITREIYVK